MTIQWLTLVCGYPISGKELFDLLNKRRTALGKEPVGEDGCMEDALDMLVLEDSASKFIHHIPHDQRTGEYSFIIGVEVMEWDVREYDDRYLRKTIDLQGDLPSWLEEKGKACAIGDIEVLEELYPPVGLPQTFLLQSNCACCT